MDPLEFIAHFLEKTRPPATRAADIETIKALLVGSPGRHPIARQAYNALWQVSLDPTETAEVRQAVTEVINQFPHLFGSLHQYGRDSWRLPSLRHLARDPDPARRAEAQGELARFGELGTVVEALHDVAPTVRAAAAEALGLHGVMRPEVLSTLDGVLADPDQAVRGVAQVALRRLGAHPLPAPPLAPPDVPSPPAGTARFAWVPFLAQWGWRVLQQEEVRADQPDAVITSGWLGYPGATEAQLAEAEQRLGRRLPPSYREFLQVTNGWPCGLSLPLLPVEQVEAFWTKDPDYAQSWMAWENDLTEEEHRMPGREQEGSFHHAYLQTALQISEQEDGYVYLLNPEVVTPEGEWEAWILGTKILGAYRWSSFWELVQEESRTQFPGEPPSEAATGQPPTQEPNA